MAILADKGTRVSVRPSRLGAGLVILTFVLSQFVELTLFTVGGFDVSLQKITALAVFLAAFLLMGHLRVPYQLVLFVLIMVLANSIAYLFEPETLNVEIYSINATIIIGFVGAVMLYTALTQYEGSFSMMARAWVVFALITSCITILQAADILPLWTVTEEAMENRTVEAGSLYRGTGLRFDPNFQALVLVIGVAFAYFYATRMRTVTILILLAGIAGTFSRMGLLVAAIVWLVCSAMQGWSSHGSVAASLRVLKATTILALLASLVYLVAPQSLQLFVEQRLADIVEALSGPTSSGMSGSSGLTSAEERILIAHTAWQILTQNLLVGVGAAEVPDEINAAVGIDKAAHNTYLEILVSGGALGALAIIVYVSVLWRALLQSGSGVEGDRRGPILAIVVAFGLMGFFLTFNYNSILWLPLVVTLAHLKLSRRRCMEGGDERLTDRR